jgi:two-component system, OmpR family, manganese sensing sensor histidine kinase
MFYQTRLQLTLAYLGVLSLILTLFTVAVRWNFTRSLNQQFKFSYLTLCSKMANTFNSQYCANKYCSFMIISCRGE